jgi:pimeloyl-ACP methyl ester carboxylesterase
VPEVLAPSAPHDGAVAGNLRVVHLAHRRLGSGEPLLLLHGVGMCKEWWAPVLDRLAASYEVVALDLPGHGESDRFPPGEDPTVARLTDAVIGFAREQGWERPHVAGISLGGLLSLELARRRDVASATAFSPAGFATGWQRTWAAGSLRANAAAYGVLAPLAERVAPFRGMLARQVAAEPNRIPVADFVHFTRAAAASDLARTARFVVEYEFPFVPMLDAPVTIAWGQKDLLLFPSQAARALEMLPGARKVGLVRAGHIPNYDDPDGTARAILETAGRA